MRPASTSFKIAVVEKITLVSEARSNQVSRVISARIGSTEVRKALINKWVSEVKMGK